MAITQINLNGTTPAAPSGNANVIWQADGSTPQNVSAYVPSIKFQTNGSNNGIQNLLNLEAGANITLVNSGGGVIISGQTIFNGNVFYATNYGVLGGAIIYCDASWSTGSNHTVTINNSTGFNDTQFTSNMNGWIVYGTNSGCPTGKQAGVGVLQVPLGVLSGITTPSNSATITTTITGSCTSTSGNPTCQLVIAPQDDATALQAAWIAAVDACGTLVLPASYMAVSTPILGPSSSQCGVQNSNNWMNFPSVAVKGYGVSQSVILPMPSFDASTCPSFSGCFFSNPVSGSTDNGNYFSGFQINGAGQGTVTNGSTKFGISVGPDSVLEEIAVNQWSIGTAIKMTGSGGAEARGRNISVFGSGTTAAAVFSAGVSCFECTLYGSSGHNLSISGNISNGKSVTNHCSIGVGTIGATINVAAGGYWESIGDYGGGNETNSTDFINCAGNCTIIGSTFPIFDAQHINVIHVPSGGVAYISNTIGSANVIGSGTGLKVDSGGVAYDLCGNDFSGSVTPYSIAGVFYPCLTAIYDSTMSPVGATGTGACATITTQTGHPFAGSLVCTDTTGVSTLILTPGQTATNGWKCSGSDLTTNLNTISQTASNQTTCTLSGTVNANDVIAFNLQPF